MKRKCSSFPQKFGVMKIIDHNKLQFELEKMKAKARYELSEYDSNTDEDPTVEDFQSDKAEIDWRTEESLPYHPVERAINLSKVRATEWPGNARK